MEAVSDTVGSHLGIQLRSSSSRHIRYPWMTFNSIMSVVLVSSPRCPRMTRLICITLKGFSITQEALSNTVSEYINSPTVSGWAGMGAAITALKNTPGLRWVNPLEIKNAVESALTDRFGVKGEAKPKGKVNIFVPVLPWGPLCLPPNNRHTLSAGTQASKGCGERSIICFYVCNAQFQISVRGRIPWQVTQTSGEYTGHPYIA